MAQWNFRWADLSAFAGKIGNDCQLISDSSSPPRHLRPLLWRHCDCQRERNGDLDLDGQQGVSFPNIYNSGQTQFNAATELLRCGSLQVNEFYKLISNRMAFLLFNVGTILTSFSASPESFLERKLFCEAHA